MLDYIKSQLGIQQKENTDVKKTNNMNDPTEIPDETILEYAQLFQELDDISIEGSDYGKQRKLGIDIPFDEDVELVTVEFNLNDGRVSDVPGDATVDDAVQEYAQMKTYEEFVQEAYDYVSRFARENDVSYNKRVEEYASKMYNEYCEDARSLGELGFDRIHISNKSIPNKVTVDFGKIKKYKSFVSKLKTLFAVDSDHTISKKQLDSIELVKNGAFTRIGKPLLAYMESKYDVPEGSNVWDLVTPNRLIVPEGKGDSFCVVLEYTNEITNKVEYFGWTSSVSKKTKTSDTMIKGNQMAFINADKYENPAMYIQESAAAYEEQKAKRMPSRVRFYQEAIDFGGDDNGDDTSEGSDDLPPADDTESSSDDTSTEGEDNTEENKNDVAVNDVSTQIAEKVSQKTQNDANNANNGEGSTESTDTDDEVPDFDNMGDVDNGDGMDSDMSVDDQLDDLDNTSDNFDDMDMGSDDMPGEEMGISGSSNIEGLTINQLLEQGSEKLKSMTLDQIKSFISSGSPEAVQEAFILTSKNILKEIDTNIRNCLGILNNKEIDFKKIKLKFATASMKLNRVLSFAKRKDKIFNKEEIDLITNLNKALSTLTTGFRKKVDKETLKKYIIEFTDASKKVSAFVEERLTSPTGEATKKGDKTIQESFLLGFNVHRKLRDAIIPVKGDMQELADLHSQGKLTRGRIMRLYTNSISTNKPVKSTMSGGTPISNLNKVLSISAKIQRKKNLLDTLGSNVTEVLMALTDDLDVISDYIESVIDDHNENKTILDEIGKLAKTIIGEMNKLIQDIQISDYETKEDQYRSSSESPEVDIEVEDTSSDDDTDNDEDTSADLDTEMDDSDNDSSDDDNDSSDSEEDKDDEESEEEDKNEDDEETTEDDNEGDDE